jgi:hypothetical protein
MLLKRQEFWLCSAIALCGALFVQAKWPVPQGSEPVKPRGEAQIALWQQNNRREAELRIATMKSFGEERFEELMRQCANEGYASVAWQQTEAEGISSVDMANLQSACRNSEEIAKKF